MKHRATFFIILPFLLCLVVRWLCSCSPSEQDTKTAPEQGTPAATVTREQTEQEYYAEEMKRFNFDLFPSGDCAPITVAPPDLSALGALPDDIVQNIRTMYAADNPNFNCRYKVVVWSCGSPCQMIAVFDSRTGRLVQTFSASLDCDFRLTSRLLILNPPSSEPMDTSYRDLVGRPEFWELRESRFRRLE